MLGYSDAAKDAGFLAANLALYRAQEALAGWARRNQVQLTLFHGRGGAVGRGGGPAGRAIRSQAPGSVAGRFKVTEQGEVIFGRYGNAAIGLRHLEQVISAVLVASTPEHEAQLAAAGERYAPAAELMAERSEAALPRARRGARLRRIPCPRQPARRDQPPPHRLPTGTPRAGRQARPGRAARDPLGLRLDAEPLQPARLVRARDRPPGGRRAAGDRVPPRDARRLALLRVAPRQRRDEPGQGGPDDRRPLPRARRPARPGRRDPGGVPPHPPPRPRPHRQRPPARGASDPPPGGRPPQPLRRRALPSCSCASSASSAAAWWMGRRPTASPTSSC